MWLVEPKGGELKNDGKRGGKRTARSNQCTIHIHVERHNGIKCQFLYSVTLVSERWYGATTKKSHEGIALNDAPRDHRSLLLVHRENAEARKAEKGPHCNKVTASAAVVVGTSTGALSMDRNCPEALLLPLLPKFYPKLFLPLFCHFIERKGKKGTST